MSAAPVPTIESWHRLRSPDRLATAVVALLAAVIATDLLAVAAGAYLRGVVADAVAGDPTAFAGPAATRADLLYARAGSLQMIAVLATAVLFIIWFHRVRRNAEVFDAGLQPMRPGWAIGGWFVPLGNFWLPRRVAGGVWAASAQTNPDGAWRTVSMAPLNLWWGVYVFSLLFTRYTAKRYEQAELLPEVMDAAGMVMVADVLDAVAAVLAILFVRKLTRMQGERAALGAAPLSAPSAAGPASV